MTSIVPDYGRYKALQWRHKERDGVSNHRRLHCLLDCWFDIRSKKTSSSVSLAFVWGIHRWLMNFLHKGPQTRKMLPFDDVIMDIFFIEPPTYSSAFKETTQRYTVIRADFRLAPSQWATSLQWSQRASDVESVSMSWRHLTSALSWLHHGMSQWVLLCPMYLMTFDIIPDRWFRHGRLCGA